MKSKKPTPSIKAFMEQWGWLINDRMRRDLLALLRTERLKATIKEHDAWVRAKQFMFDGVKQ
jgi:hypothetical protein